MQMMLNAQTSDRRRAKKKRIETNLEKFEKNAPKLGGPTSDLTLEMWIVKVEEEADRLGIVGEEDFVLNLRSIMVDETADGTSKKSTAKAVNWPEKHMNILNKKSFRATRKVRRSTSTSSSADRVRPRSA